MITDDSRGEYVNLVPKAKEYIKQEKVKKEKEKKSSGIFKGKFLKKPKLGIKSISPEKVLTSGMGHHALVREGRTGYFNDEYEREMKWLRK